MEDLLPPPPRVHAHSAERYVSLLALLALIAGFAQLVVWLGVMPTFLTAFPDASHALRSLLAFGGLAVVAGAVGYGFLSLAPVVHGRNAQSYLTRHRAFRWWLLVAGAAGWGGVLALLAASNGLLAPRGWDAALETFWLVPAVLVLAVVLAGVEELLLRGWVLDALRRVAGGIHAPILLTAFVGTGLHVWLGLRPAGEALLLGLVAGYAARLARGSEAAVGAGAAHYALSVWAGSVWASGGEVFAGWPLALVAVAAAVGVAALWVMKPRHQRASLGGRSAAPRSAGFQTIRVRGVDLRIPRIGLNSARAAGE